MEQDYDARLKLIAQLLDAKTQSSYIMSQYFAILQEGEFRNNPSMREIHYILAVEPWQGKSITELAEILGVTQGAVSQTVSHLEGKGFLVRVRNPENYRQIRAVLTQQGEQIYQAYLEQDKKMHAHMDRKYFQNYSDEELRQYRDYELRMIEVFTTVNETLKKNRALKSR